jgi:hypothetical protein
MDRQELPDSILTRGGFNPKKIRFVLGTAGFLLSYPSSLFDSGTIKTLAVTVPSIKPLKFLPQKHK